MSDRRYYESLAFLFRLRDLHEGELARERELEIGDMKLDLQDGDVDKPDKEE